MDPRVVSAYLSERLGEPTDVRSLRQTFPGQSRETWLVRTAARGLVLRLDPPGGGVVPFPLRREWEIYVRLAPSPIPVGEPLWFDDGCELSDGRPLFVRELVEGDTDVPGLNDPGPEGAALRERVAKEHAEKLAALHTLDWKRYGFDEVLDAPASTAEAGRFELETWRTIWDEVRTSPFPAITRALYWLEDRLPKGAARVSLLKGNNGLGEEIWRDATIVALSDWELASLGDPVQDWAFSQGMLRLWDEEKTLRHYEQAAGFEIARESLAFWRVWTVFKALCCVHAGLRGFLDGRDPRVALPAMGMGGAKVGEHVLAMLTQMELEPAAQMLASMQEMSGRGAE